METTTKIIAFVILCFAIYFIAIMADDLNREIKSMQKRKRHNRQKADNGNFKSSLVLLSIAILVIFLTVSQITDGFQVTEFLNYIRRH